jgi:hypothetical protein
LNDRGGQGCVLAVLVSLPVWVIVILWIVGRMGG